MNDIVVVTFNEQSNAYQALTALKELNTSGRLVLRSAVVVERQADGQPIVHDNVNATDLFGDLKGTIGDLVDGLRGIQPTASIAANIPSGSTGLIAELDEYAVEVIDDAMSQLGGTVYRKQIGYVEAELATAENDRVAAAHQDRERERAEKHNERLDHAEHWLEGKKKAVPPPQVAPAETAAQD
jgi:uncharacterized membrane protein